MGEINTPVASSPSKSINDGAKKNWKGGLDHGTTSPNVGDAYNKKPIPVSPSKPRTDGAQPPITKK